jgi:hypothetical protein
LRRLIMSNIVQLYKAKEQTPVGRGQQEMLGLQKIIKIKLQQVMSTKRSLTMAEADLKESTNKYDEAFTIYAERVGLNNIDVDYLNFTTNVSITFDLDGNLVLNTVNNSKQ